jgi:hypothetical protein
MAWQKMSVEMLLNMIGSSAALLLLAVSYYLVTPPCQVRSPAAHRWGYSRLALSSCHGGLGQLMV